MKKILFLLLFSFLIVSCEKIDFDEMREEKMSCFYQESLTLEKIGIDAFTIFCQDYYHYLGQEPKAKESKYHTKIEENIQSALNVYDVTINIVLTGWNDPVNIGFEIKDR